MNPYAAEALHRGAEGLPVLWAKLGVYAVVSFLLMLPCAIPLLS